MKIQIVAYSLMTTGAYEIMEPDPDSSPAEDLVELAGRACYQSFHKPNPATTRNEDYLSRTVIGQHHESIAEHASVSFYVEGVSRNLLLELERHRHLSFSVVSQRFVDSSETEFVAPPAIRELLTRVNTDAESGSAPVANLSDILDAADLSDEVINLSRDAYLAWVKVLEARGYSRKQSREAARAFLPGGLETKFIVTGNLRAWRDVLRKRYSTHADAEICEFASEILRLLKRDVSAILFDDFGPEPFDD